MYKEISTWILVLVLVVIFISTVLFGTLLVHYYEYGVRYPKTQKIAISISSIPINFEKILRYGNTLEPLKQVPKVYQEKNSIIEKKKDINGNYIKFYNKNLDEKRNQLLILPRYESKNKLSIVEIIDLNNLKVIHRYNHDIDKTYKNLKVGKDNTRKRFQYGHPLILDDGSLISKNVMFSPLFKIDICGNDIWRNNDLRFHHSIERDHENNIWVGSTLKKVSQDVTNELSLIRKGMNFADDSISKINHINGEVIYKKSIASILLENKIFFDSDVYTSTDPIHLNDIQPVLSDGPHWKKGDIFLSLLRNSSIIHYRPKTNELVNYIRGPFFEQHDVDIISDYEISIFNNNNSRAKDNVFSEILIYNFKSKKFKKILTNQLETKNFKTPTEGLADFMIDGSSMLEETNSGRILFFNSKGELEWEFLNIGEDGKIYPISWSRLITDVDLVKNIKESISNKKCTN